MYDIPPFTIKELIFFGLIIALIISIIVMIRSILIKRKGRSTIMDSLKAFFISGIILISIGFKCRNSSHKTDYESMIKDRTLDFTHALYLQNFDDSAKIYSLKKFLITNWIDQIAKDSVKVKSLRFTKTYLSLMDDLIRHSDISSSDTLALSKNTTLLYNKTIITDWEKNISDSLINPLLREVNNKQGEIYARLRFTKGFAQIDELKNMQSLIKQNQEEAKKYYLFIFKEKSSIFD